MGKLCVLLERCFPRNQKLALDTLLTRLVKASKGRSLLQCAICLKDVSNTLAALKQHLSLHKRFQ